jgi:hypothetical protein
MFFFVNQGLNYCSLISAHGTTYFLTIDKKNQDSTMLSLLNLDFCNSQKAEAYFSDSKPEFLQEHADLVKNSVIKSQLYKIVNIIKTERQEGNCPNEASYDTNHLPISWQ